MPLFSRSPQPRCPVTEDDRIFIDSNLAWMRFQFGRLEVPSMLAPSKIRLPSYSSLEDLGQAMLRFVSKQMDIDPDTVDLHFFEEGNLDNHLHTNIQSEEGYNLGEYHHRNNLTGKFDIAINLESLKSPEQGIATFAHELAHLKLIGEGRISGEEETNELLTDLTAVYFGFGVFMVNTAFQRKTWSNGEAWEGWSISKSGYLPVEMINYALAFQSFLMDQLAPDWLQDLSRANRRMVKESLLFLQEEKKNRPE